MRRNMYLRKFLRRTHDVILLFVTFLAFVASCSVTIYSWLTNTQPTAGIIALAISDIWIILMIVANTDK